MITKYDREQVVWYAKDSKYHKCKECGHEELIYNGAYEPCELLISDISSGCTGIFYESNCGIRRKERYLFATKEECQARCDELNGEII